VGLNPSTADETKDDPTIRRCAGFAKTNGYGAMLMINLFALRSTNPKNLGESADPVGIKNDYYIARVVQESKIIIVAWGNFNKGLALHSTRDKEVLTLLPKPVYCLGCNLTGAPKHPL